MLHSAESSMIRVLKDVAIIGTTTYGHSHNLVCMRAIFITIVFILHCRACVGVVQSDFIVG